MNSNRLKSNYYSNKYATGRYRDNNNINDKIDTEINKINLSFYLSELNNLFKYID